MPTLPNWTSPLNMAADLAPTHGPGKVVHTPALDLIDHELWTAARTPGSRLAVSVAPQEGKSSTVARAYPLWRLWLDPSLRVVIVSYDLTLARAHASAVRDQILQHPELGMRIKQDTRAKHEWKLEGGVPGREGGVYASGIGGPLTGRPADCVRGDMQVESEHGVTTAERAFDLGISRIRAYDHRTNQAVWRRVVATRRISSRSTVEVTTASGRVLVCTPDHQVYTGRGYVPAGNLRPGEALVAFVAAGRVSLRSLAPCAAGEHTEGDSARAEGLLL